MTTPISKVEALMNSIKHLDTNPPIFKVTLSASVHMNGFSAYVNFRDIGAGAPSCLEAHGYTPEDALMNLEISASKMYGRCAHCGGFRTPE